MKLKREDFKGIEDALGLTYVEEIPSSGSIIYRTQITEDYKLCVGMHFDYCVEAIVASVSVYGSGFSVNKCSRDLQTQEDTVRWVLKTIDRLEYHANELKDL